jgi:uncharacterized protein (DUF1810 family)
LAECTKTVCGIQGRSIDYILGSPDDIKSRCLMTLFEAVSDNPIFRMRSMNLRRSERLSHVGHI